MTHASTNTPAGPWLPAAVPDRTRLVALPTGNVFVVDVGPGAGGATLPPLLLVHGLFTTHYAFAKLIPVLATTRRVVAVDLPGCGDSDHPHPQIADDYSADWLAETCLHTMGVLGIETFDVLGHDYGGAVAITMASRFRRAVRRLAVLDAVALSLSLPLGGTLGIAPSLGVEVFRRTLRRADLRKFLVQGLSTPELLDECDVDVYWDRLGRRGARQATHAMLTQLSEMVRLRERLGSLELPTRIIWGDRDELVPLRQGQRLEQLIEGARLDVIEGCGHNPAFERPDEVARAVGSWSA